MHITDPCVSGHVVCPGVPWAGPSAVCAGAGRGTCSCSAPAPYYHIIIIITWRYGVMGAGPTVLQLHASSRPYYHLICFWN